MKGVIDNVNNREEPPTVLRGEVQERVDRSGGVWVNWGARAGWMPGSLLPLLLARGG